MSCYVLWNCVPSCYAMQCNIVYSMSVCFCMCIKGHHVCQILNNLTLGESHANMTLGHRVPSSHGGKSAKVRFSFWFLFWYLKLLVSQISFFKQQKVWEGMMLGMFSSISPPPVEFTDFPVFYPFKIGCEIVLGFFFGAGLGFFLDFLAGTICLVFATVWNLNLSFCMVFATFGHVHLPFCMGFTTCGHVHLPFCMVFATFWHVHLPFCMGFTTCGHVHLPFCMVFATFWHVHLPFCMGCSTCEHVHPNIYRCGSLGLDKKRVGGIEGGR